MVDLGYNEHLVGFEDSLEGLGQTVQVKEETIFNVLSLDRSTLTVSTFLVDHQGSKVSQITTQTLPTGHAHCAFTLLN